MCESFLEAFLEWEIKKTRDDFVVELFSDGSGKLMDHLTDKIILKFDDVSELIEFFRKD